MKRLTLEWAILDRDHVALVFNRETWMAFHQIAGDRGVDPRTMIAEALAGLPGTVMMRTHPTET